MESMPEFHFYRPSEGHGLPHDPFKAIVAHPVQRAGYTADFTEATTGFQMGRPQ